MKANTIKNIVATALAILFIAAPKLAVCQQADKTFMAIEFNQVVCGYAEIIFSDTIINGNDLIILQQKVFANFHALGRDISQHQKFLYYIDRQTGRFTYHKSYHKQGDFEMGGDTYVDGNRLRIVTLDGEEEIQEIPEGTILPNTQLYTYLKNDFADKELDSRKYNVYDLRTRQVKEIEYTKTGEERIELNGKKYEALVFSELDTTAVSQNKLWIRKDDGMRLKMESSNKLNMYITDSLVVKRIKTGNWDASFFIKTNREIHDLRSISYMKARVKIEALPRATMEDLCVKGQQFKGAIDENFIVGEFIIAHRNYDGKNAPEFPFEKEKYDFPEAYLEPGEGIESDDPELIALAEKITRGSDNLWDASCRISHWVAINIEGSILDGTARDTYKQKSGLCGAQSKLMAALCRAAGIPARVVWGCMYTMEQGGSFGHHGWNEVYMGEAGWIPLDVTIHETDYVDSGHIRLGELKTSQTIINYEEISILDYEL